MAFLPGLSGVKDILFGKEASTQTQTLPTMSPEQQKALQDLLAMLGSPDNPLLKGYGGQLTADQNQAQLSSLTALEQAALRNVPGGEGYSTTAAKGLQDVIGRGPAEIDKYFQSAIAAPLQEQFTSQILPELTRRFSGQSGFSSDRVSAERAAAGGLEREMAKALTEATMQQEAQRIAAAQALSGVGAQEIQNILGIQAGGTAAQAAAQAPLTAKYQEFQRQLSGQQMTIEDILRALGLQPKENIVSVLPGQQGLIQGMMQGASQGAGQAIGKGMMGG